MGVTTAFVSGLIVAIPILVVLIVGLVIWRCNVISKRKKKLLSSYNVVVLRPAATQLQVSDEVTHSTSQSHPDALEISKVPNSEVLVSASFTMAKDYDRNILQSYSSAAGLPTMDRDQTY